MHRLLLIVAVVAGCHSSPPPAHPPEVVAVVPTPPPPAPPPPPDCTGAVSRAMARSMDESMKQLKDLPPDERKTAEDLATEMAPRMKAAITKVCVDDHWSTDAIACFDAGHTQAELYGCRSKLTDAQYDNLQRAMSAMMVPVELSRSAPPAAPAPAPAPAPIAAPVLDAHGVPVACVRYGDAVERLMRCTKLPKESRDALKQGYDAMKSAWVATTWTETPADSVAATADACATGADALTQAGTSVCGW